MMSDLKIVSVNCQGLGDFKKRKDVFQFYRKLGCNILCLQDTHFTKRKRKRYTESVGF